MTTLQDQLTRVQLILQDTSTDPTTMAILARSHIEALEELARERLFTNVQWMQGIAGQATYTLPAATVTPRHVLYNMRVLRYTTETSLDRLHRGWEARGVEDPTYWTLDNQAPNTIRIVPAPLRTGDTAPVYPQLVPLVQPLQDNLVVFLYDDPALEVTDLGDTLPTLADWDDYLVYKTVQEEAMKETTVQNLPVAELCGQLAQLWMSLVARRP